MCLNHNVGSASETCVKKSHRPLAYAAMACIIHSNPCCLVQMNLFQQLQTRGCIVIMSCSCGPSGGTSIKETCPIDEGRSCLLFGNVSDSFLSKADKVM